MADQARARTGAVPRCTGSPVLYCARCGTASGKREKTEKAEKEATGAYVQRRMRKGRTGFVKTHISVQAEHTETRRNTENSKKKAEEYGMINENKCAVIGCGYVGASIAYTYAESGLFSEMVLIDVNRAKAEGEALDIAHGLPFLAPMHLYAGDYPDLADAGLIVIAAGANQKPGETRLDLLARNLRIFDSILEGITAWNREGILLVVTNPVDLLTLYTLRRSGFPASRVIGSGTVLDTARLKFLVGRHFSVDPRNVHTFIIGEHGDSEVPVFSSANISGINLDDFCRLSGMEDQHAALFRMFEEVRDSAYRIIEGKGATYYAIAQSVLRITRSLLRDENSVLPVSTLVEGHYGVRDICLGVPSIVGREGVKKILDLPLDAEESRLFRHSADTVRSTLEAAEGIRI